MTVNVTIEFPTQEHLEDFASWMCNSGEQYYGLWQSALQPSPPSGRPDDRRVAFHYHGVENEEFPVTDARRFGPFLCDNTIRTTAVADDA